MKRKAFGMIYAIIITVLVAGLGILSLRLSNSTLNTTTNEYIAIQLELYADSTIELAILYIQRNGFVDQENSDTKRANAMQPIEKYINYGANNEYQFKYKMTPLIDNSATNADEQQKNVMILDISGSVTNPVTNQTLRVTKRRIIKP